MRALYSLCTISTRCPYVNQDGVYKIVIIINVCTMKVNVGAAPSGPELIKNFYKKGILSRKHNFMKHYNTYFFSWIMSL